MIDAPDIWLSSLEASGPLPLNVAPVVRETPSPSAEVLRIIRGYDPEGFWTRRAD